MTATPELTPDAPRMIDINEQAPDPSWMEPVACYYCGADDHRPLETAQDDLTGKPGDFTFVTCNRCGLAYQTPRIDIDHIGRYYDDEYIAHRKETNWGLLSKFYEWGMDKHDREKEKLVRRFVDLDQTTRVLDVGCGSGSFLQKLRRNYEAEVAGVDFKDLTHLPFFEGVTFYQGLFYDQDLPHDSFDLVTMWHFLEHDYDPLRTLETAGRVLRRSGRLVIEVPRLDCVSYKLYRNRWPGLQAPQHTVLYSKQMLLNFVRQAGFEVEAYLPYGAFPAYFYLFAGAAFRWRRGKGINFRRAIYPYFLGQLALSPILLFERYLNLAMQTVVCRRTD